MSNLALLGGSQAITKSFVGENGIRPFIPNVTDAAVETIKEMLQSGQLSVNPIVQEFEENFKKYLGVKFALCQCSGTMSIQAGLFGMGIGRGDEVIVPSFTFFATATPVLTLGAIPVFADVDADSHTLSPKAIEEKITPNTKAIVLVHTWGNPADMDGIMALAKKYNLKVLEDCSHAHGAEYKGKKVGTFGDAAAFSFQGEKLMAAGEGGILVTNDENVIFRAAALGSYERLRGQSFFAGTDTPDATNLHSAYNGTALGMKLRPFPISMAIVNEELKRLDERNAVRNKNGEYLDQLLSDLPCFKPLKVLDGAKRVYAYHYVNYDENLNHGIMLHTVMKALAAAGAAVGGCGYGALHTSPAFTQLDGNWPKCYPNAPVQEAPILPVTEQLRQTSIMIAPRFEDPNQEVVEQYAEAYHKVLSATDELLKYQSEHLAELEELKPKTGRSRNMI